MTDYLLKMGHEKIGVIGGRKDNIHMDKRLLGYREPCMTEKYFTIQILYAMETGTGRVVMKGLTH